MNPSTINEKVLSGNPPTIKPGESLMKLTLETPGGQRLIAALYLDITLSDCRLWPTGTSISGLPRDLDLVGFFP
jgi:hypothetical protein